MLIVYATATELLLVPLCMPKTSLCTPPSFHCSIIYDSAPTPPHLPKNVRRAPLPGSVSHLINAEKAKSPVISKPLCAASVILKYSLLSASKSAELSKVPPASVYPVPAPTVFVSANVLLAIISARVPDASSRSHRDTAFPDCGKDAVEGYVDISKELS